VVDALDLEALASGLAELCLLGRQAPARAAASAAVADLTLSAMVGRLLALYRSL